jgi:8-oxo-dGTP diphosphatase
MTTATNTVPAKAKRVRAPRRKAGADDNLLRKPAGAPRPLATADDIHPLKAAGGFRPLKTERLTLRPLQPADAEAMHRLVNDWEVTRTLAELPYPYPRDLADEWIVSTAEQMQAGTGYYLAITGYEGKTEILVGVVGLRLDPAARTGRLG